MKHLLLCGLVVVVLGCGGVAAQEAAGGEAASAPPVTPPGVTLSLEQTPLRQALRIWSVQSGRQLVVTSWPALELAGVDPETPITLRGIGMPPGRALRLILSQASATAAVNAGGVGGTETELIYRVTPWYVEVMSKAIANRRPTTRVYYIGDLLHEVPNFTDAPSFSLTDALSNTNSGGGGGSGGGGDLFEDDNDNEEQVGTTRESRGEALAGVIRDTIEPTIWLVNGGTAGAITYRQNHLIIRAPFYVHNQIGKSIPAVRRPAANGTRTGSTPLVGQPVSGIRSN
ncbi:MAG: hypothetical protein AAF797_11455 [Planctomycetota bacterium]